MVWLKKGRDYMPDFKPTMKDYKKLTPFKFQILQSFPFIAEDFDSLTNYELLCKVVEYLNDVIKNENNVEDNVTALYNSFIELQDYVNNYFDNLDVQDEINNKLDEMVEEGTLQEIIADYLNSKAIFGFDTVDSMKSATNLIAGSYAKTLGYYTKNDGGSGLYKIRNITNQDIVDEGSIIALNDNNLVAELIIENNIINIKQLGARSQSKDNVIYDIKNYIINYFNILDKHNSVIKLYIPSGIYYTSPITIARNKGFYIYGDKVYGFDKGQGTIISAIDNQDYVFNIGNNLVFTQNWTLENIIFSTCKYNYNSSTNIFEKQSYYTVNNQVMKMLYCSFGIFNDIFFLEINGEALSLSSCWEIYSNNITFRRISNINGCIMKFDSADTTLLETANITACQFDKLFFESVHGDLIQTNNANELYNCHIGTINFEDYPLNRNDVTYTTYTDENISTFENDNTAVHYAIVNMNKGAFNVTIDSIDLNNISTRYFSKNNILYSYDTIFKLSDNYCYLGTTVNAISITGMKKDLRLLKMNDGLLPYIKSKLCINAIVNSSDYICYFDCYGFPYIECNSLLSQTQNVYHNILGNEYTPFYQIALVRKALNRGYLYYNTESRTPLRLCCKMLYKSGFANFQLIAPSNTLIIHGKVANGETLNITVYDATSGRSGTISLEGDGTFKDYSFDITSYIRTGNVITLGLNSNSANIEHYLDYYRFE